MCTAVHIVCGHGLFGRTLDVTHGYDEQVVIAPRKMPFSFSNGQVSHRHFSMIGMAYLTETGPLYFDAMNEHGLCMAGLRFPDTAYAEPHGTEREIAPYELITRVLSCCQTADDAVALLNESQIVRRSYAATLPVTPLHWLIADRRRSVTVECVDGQTMVYDNPFGILTNAPSFSTMADLIPHYCHLSPDTTGASQQPPYSYGIGAVGLPGDLTSMSRFVRAQFFKRYARWDGPRPIGQFFHLMDTVKQMKGVTRTDEGDEYTRYTSCCDQQERVYYYTTYGCRAVAAVSLSSDVQDGEVPICYPVRDTETSCAEN